MITPLSKIDIEIIKSIEIIFFDFDGVFTDNYVYVNEEGIESIKSSRADGLGIARLKSLGIETFIVSTEKNNVVEMRAKKLNIKCSHGIDNKAHELKKICENLSVDPNKTMFVGNDINDIPAFEYVGVPVGVADSFKEIHSYISFITNKEGGNGVVREICDLFHNSLIDKGDSLE
ncbi:HAD hydrolase family protein [Gammaproteobacteria bacterium]|nr:HAD hydrolase family protein [Gammaproteobacteria bacterium]